jgi:hypothetical protein
MGIPPELLGWQLPKFLRGLLKLSANRETCSEIFELAKKV